MYMYSCGYVRVGGLPVSTILYVVYITCVNFYNCRSVAVPFYVPPLNWTPFSSRQEGGELADDVISPPHSGHQLPVPALPVGGA